MSNLTSVSISSSGSTFSSQHNNNNNNNNNITNIAESISDASSSLIPSRHQQQLRQIQVHEWQPDDAVESCTICDKKFTFWVRKHHCRKCGRVVCNTCSLNEITYLPSTYVVCPPSQIFLESPHVPHRTCDPCYEEVEMIRSALSESLIQTEQQNQGVATDDSSAKDLSSSRTIECQGSSNRHINADGGDEDSFKDRCPVCNKFIGCFAEDQKADHINDCLVNLEFSGSPKQQRTNNRMLVYTIPKTSPHPSGITIPSLNTALRDNTGSSFEMMLEETSNGNPSTSVDTLTTAGRANERPLSSSARSGTSTLNTTEEKKEEGETECVICFEEFEPGDKVARMECLCVFHYRCIKDWFKKKGERECPVHTLHYD